MNATVMVGLARNSLAGGLLNNTAATADAGTLQLIPSLAAARPVAGDPKQLYHGGKLLLTGVVCPIADNVTEEGKTKIAGSSPSSKFVKSCKSSTASESNPVPVFLTDQLCLSATAVPSQKLRP